MRAVIIAALAAFALPLLQPMHVTAFGFNPLEWEIQGLKNEVRGLNNTLQNQRSLDTFRSLSNARSATLQRLRGMGYDAFTPTNEGSIRAGLAKTAQCPANAHALLDYCVCDQGYAYTGIVNKCQNSSTSSVTELQKQCPNYPIPDAYPSLKQACKGISPEAETAYQACPVNSYEDPKNRAYCICNGNYQWNSDKTQCLPKLMQRTNMPRARTVTRACPLDNDGICQCPVGFTRASQRGRQICTK